MLFKEIDVTKTKQQGNIGLGRAIAYFCYKGCTVSIPLNDAQEYDLIVDIESTLYKVQVKTTRKRATSGHYAVELRSNSRYTNRAYSDGIYDLLYIVTEAGVEYLIPSSEITTTTSITLNSTKDNFIIHAS